MVIVYSNDLILTPSFLQAVSRLLQDRKKMSRETRMKRMNISSSSGYENFLFGFSKDYYLAV
jgi:hypothetical protein